MQNRLFKLNTAELTFEWNGANQADWRTIQRNFVAAYLHAYEDKSFSELMFKPEVIEKTRDEWKIKYEQFLKEGMPFLKREIIHPLEFYMTHKPSALESETKEFEHHLADKKYEINKTTDQIVKLLILKRHFESDFKEEKHKIDSKSKKIDYIIARYHEQPVVFFVCELNYKTGFIYLRFVTIEPAFHRLGLGRKMLQQITKRYPDAKGLELYTRRANYSAQSFYKSIGFQEYKEFSFEEPMISLKPDNKLYFPTDDSTSQPEAFIGFRKKYSRN